MNPQNTDPDDAALRYWLRLQPGIARHRKPAWLDHNIDPATTGILLKSLLGQWVAAGHLRRHHAYVWTAQAGLLSSAPLRQKELAAKFGVSDRTIRAWVTHADSAITRQLKSLDLQAFLSATPVSSELSAHARGVVSIAALMKSLIVEDAPTEHLEAVRTYAADHLGGPPPPRRPGAKRWIRQRFSSTVGVRAAAAARTVLADQSVEPQLSPPLLAMPYRLADQPIAAISELSRAWNNRDRAFLPLLANHALRTAHAHPEVPVENRLHMLEVIANALRDAENLQAFVVATQWKLLAANAFGPLDPRVWKAEGMLIHMMEIHGYTAAARRAQQRHIATFHQARFTDPEDRALHDLDRFARLITIETAHPTPGSRERTQTLLHHMRTAYDRRQSPGTDNDFAMLRRRLEVTLTDAVAASRGQPIRGHRLDSLSAALENFGTDLQAHRALARHELLLKIDVARRDWVTLRQRTAALAQAINHPAAPANLAERIRARLDALTTRGHLGDTPHLVIPIDPFRDHRFGPLTAAVN